MITTCQACGSHDLQPTEHGEGILALGKRKLVITYEQRACNNCDAATLKRTGVGEDPLRRVPDAAAGVSRVLHASTIARTGR